MVGREVWPKVWQDGATAGKLLLDAMTFPWPCRADCTPLITKNTPLTSGAILDEKSLTALFSDQLHYNSQSHRHRFQKGKKKVFKHKGLKKPKNNYLISGPMKVHTVLDSIVLIIKSKLIKGSTSSDIAQAAKLLPRVHPQVSVSGILSKVKEDSSLLLKGVWRALTRARQAHLLQHHFAIMLHIICRHSYASLLIYLNSLLLN